MKKRNLAKLTIFVMKIIFGILDTVTPNINNSITGKTYCPIEKKDKLNIDYVRLISSFIFFVILVLNFFGFTDIAKQIKFIIETIYIKLRG